MPEQLTPAQLEQVKEVVQVTLQAGDFRFPNGATPQKMLADHEMLFAGHEGLQAGQITLSRDMGKVLDVVVGPVKVDWRGDPDPDQERDETVGMMAKTDRALEVSEKMDHHLDNGGVPVKLPTGTKVAIWGAAGTVAASVVTAAGFVIAAAL